jgi:chaperone required for assembly of F1-ATPase
MREFLDDVHEHMDDGYGRAQAHTKTELRKRFYSDVNADEIEGGFAINLDGRPTKTPGMQKIIVPSRRLAELMVAEWAMQETNIDPRTMPIVRLVNSAIEGGGDVTLALREEILNFAGNDLLLFRAESPKELVALQKEQWDGLLVKLEKHFGVLFVHKN